MTAAGFRHILLATDLSARCDRALARAAALARDHGARLSLVHAIEATDMSDAGEESIARAARRARRLLGADVAGLEGVDADLHVDTGPAEAVVAAFAEQLGCDLIVTGIAGNDWLGRSLLGATAAALTRGATRPVLVVKERVAGPYRRVVVASDLSDASRPATERAFALFGRAEIVVFHAFALPFRNWSGDSEAYELAERQAAAEACRKALAELALPAPAHLSIVAEHGDAAETLARLATERGADLVVAGTHGRSGLAGALLGSVAAQILDEAPCDVLVVPSRAG